MLELCPKPLNVAQWMSKRIEHIEQCQKLFFVAKNWGRGQQQQRGYALGQFAEAGRRIPESPLTGPNQMMRFVDDEQIRDMANAGEVLMGTHLEKGCYRGQETVARVHTLGRPPRRLVQLHLDGSLSSLPETGASLMHNGRAVGFVGSSARHHELGPIALALVKRNVPIDAELLADEIPAAQETLVDPDVGLHIRPVLR